MRHLSEIQTAVRNSALAATLCTALVLSPSAIGIEAYSPSFTPAADEGRYQLAQGEILPTPRPVSYSRDQADRGEDRYERACLECHGDDLRGGLNGGAPLRGLNFEQKFANGAPASALYLFTSTRMPPNAPGRYSPNTYADLVAYILKRNGFRSGEPLPSDIDVLDYLIMEK